MPIHMFCPKGHELVTEDQYAGRKVRCPHCQAIVIVPKAPPTAVKAGPAPAPPPAPRPDKNAIDEGDVLDDQDMVDDDVVEVDVLDDARSSRKRLRDYDDDYDDTGRSRKKKKKKGMTRQQMSMTNLGLGFHYAKIITILAGIAVYILGALLIVFAGAGAAASGPQNVQAAGGVAVLAMVVSVAGAGAIYFVAPLLGITGSSLCCWVPGKTGARPLIITSLVLDCAALVLPIIAMILAGATAAMGGFRAAGAAGGAAMIFTMLSPLLSLAGFILFMLFLRQLANFLDQPGDADEAVSIIILSLFLLVGAPILFGVFIGIMVAVAPRDQGGSAALGCILGLAMFIAMIAWFVFVIKLLFRILNLIGSQRQTLRTRYGV